MFADHIGIAMTYMRIHVSATAHAIHDLHSGRSLLTRGSANVA